MNLRGVLALYKFEMHRFRRTLWTGLAVPVITTTLYFVVFGAAIGSRMTEGGGGPHRGLSRAGPVIVATLFCVVFGAAIGSRMTEVGGVPYGAFIVPGLMMLTLFNESIFNASFGIHMPRFTGTIYEILSAPLSPVER